MAFETKKLSSFPIYPFLIAYYPILYIYSQNVGLTDFSATVYFTVVTFGLTAILWLLLNFWLENRHKSGLITAVVMLFLLTYDHIYNLTEPFAYFVIDLHKHRYLILAFFLLIVGLAFSLRKTTAHTAEKIGKVATMVSIVLLLIPLTTIVHSFLSVEMFPAFRADINQPESIHLSETKPKEYPDIYYIILDGYGREDVLKKKLGFDNTAFVQELEKRKFYVAERSHSNYSQTVLSITSSLNLNYLQELYNPQEESLSRFKMLYQKNKVVETLNSMGYQTISTSTGYDFTNNVNTKVQLSPEFEYNEFETILLNSTPLPPLINSIWLRNILGSNVSANMFEQHRNRMKFAFSRLSTLGQEYDEPIFAFVHIMLAHPPFVFSAKGDALTPPGPYMNGFPKEGHTPDTYTSAYAAAYKEQVLYGNQKILKLLDSIFLDRSNEKIIIIQGDHGSRSQMPSTRRVTKSDLEEQMSILNAYYISAEESYNFLYEYITPVNSFRMILNRYLGFDYELLQDKSYYSYPGNRFNFILANDSLDSNLQSTVIK